MNLHQFYVHLEIRLVHDNTEVPYQYIPSLILQKELSLWLQAINFFCLTYSNLT